MSMASPELKDIKTTLQQILQNQTAMMAQIVLMNKQQAQQHQQQTNMASVLNSPINKSFLEAIKSKFFGQVAKSPQRLQALLSPSGIKMDYNKHPPSSNAPKNAIPSSAMLTGPQKRKVELPMDDEMANSKHQRAHSQKPEVEGGMNEKAELGAKKKSSSNKEKQSKASEIIHQNQRFCSLCNTGVEIGSLVDHVWEHLKRKMVEDKDPNNVSIYGFLCDAADCNFRTNKLELAKKHAKSAHPSLHPDKIIINNTENNNKLFKIALDQCFETMEQAEKDMINLRCFD